MAEDQALTLKTPYTNVKPLVQENSVSMIIHFALLNYKTFFNSLGISLKLRSHKSSVAVLRSSRVW